MKIGIQKTVEVEAKTLHVYLKVRDEFYASLVDQDGKVIMTYEGYVPGFMPGEHYGDYVDLEIDIETGQIKNWMAPTREDIEGFLLSADADSDTDV